MSLTTFLKCEGVSAKFREVFALPPVAPLGKLHAEPLTKNYSLVGTAFDYLLRFYLEQLHPSAQAKHWIAEAALMSTLLRNNHSVSRQARIIVRTARERHQTFMQNGRITDDLLRSCVLLAQIDPIFRRDVIVPNFGQIDERDVIDLRNLINLITPATFPIKNVCLLDPTFGVGSQLVEGADVDLVIDEAIIDIKTTINPKLQREYFNQVVGYYILSRIGEIGGLPIGHHISQIGIYSARFGRLYLFKMEDLASEAAIKAFAQWFVERAQQEFGTDLTKLKALRF